MELKNAMTENSCYACRRPKAQIQCEVCSERFCKNCSQFLESSIFSFMKDVPESLKHTHYCMSCFDSEVQPALENYRELIEQARSVFIFFTTQKKAIPLIKKSKEKVVVEACDDRDETILRLAFQAAQQGYNAVIETEVVAQKIRNEGYQKSVWRGVGVPAQVNAERMERY